MPSFLVALDATTPEAGVFAYLNAPANTTCTLATGDGIQLVVSSDTAGAVVSSQNLTTTIRPLPR